MSETGSNFETSGDENHEEIELSWPRDDLLELIRRIDENTPKNANTRVYRKLLPLLDWESIAFKSYTSDECRETFKQIQKNLNRNRTLLNAIKDVKKLLNKPHNIVHTIDMYETRPKRPFTAWYYFFNDAKQHLAKENLTVAEIAIKAKEMYQKLPWRVKQKYKAKADQCCKLYRLQRQAFFRNHPKCPKTYQEIKEKRIDVRNKELKTPFELFFENEIKKQETRNIAFSLINLKSECKTKWTYMSNKKKVFWINWSNQQYLNYLKNYNENMAKSKSIKTKFPRITKALIKPVLSKTEEKILECYRNRPIKKPHNSVYLLFVHKMLENFSLNSLNLSLPDVADFIAIQWTLLSEDDKNALNWYLEQSKETYKDRLNEYLKYLPEDEYFLEFTQKENSFVKKHNFLTDRRVKKTKKRKKTLPNEPKLPSPSAERYYSSLFKKKLWSELERSEQVYYEQAWNEEVKEYIKKFKQFLEGLTTSDLLLYTRNVNEIDDDYDEQNSYFSSSDEDEDENKNNNEKVDVARPTLDSDVSD